MGKYNIKVIFTNHAKERMSRLCGVSEEFVKKDLLRDIYSARKFEASPTYQISGKEFKYIISFNEGKIILITILFKRRKGTHRRLEIITKEEIKKLLCSKK